MCSGNVFHADEPACEKARSPNLVRKRGKCVLNRLINHATQRNQTLYENINKSWEDYFYLVKVSKLVNVHLYSANT